MTNSTNDHPGFSSSSLVTSYASYNHWAAKRIASWLETKAANLFEENLASSFPSLRATLSHSMYTEANWMCWLQGEMPGHKYGQTFEGPVPELLIAYLAQGAITEKYVRGLSEGQLQADVYFSVPVRWPEYDDFYRPAYELIMHMVNHSTYHRGQIVTMARQLGITDPPNTDYMYFLLMARDK